MAWLNAIRTQGGVSREGGEGKSNSVDQKLDRGPRENSSYKTGLGLMGSPGGRR